MKGYAYLSLGISVVLILSFGGATANTQAAPLTPTPPPSALELPFPRSNSLEALPHQPGAEPPANTIESLDALALYPWSRLTFQSFRNLSNWDVFVGNDDGSGQTQVTFDGASDLHSRFNRGATRIAFASRRTGNYEIFTMNPDGSGLTQITFNSADDVQPYWSPDGSKIAFQAYRDGQPEVYVMNADGSGPIRLTYNADYDGEPAWSPDGNKIAFVSKRTAGAGDYFIYVMNADGNNQVQLSGQTYSQGPVWSPDGARIAYSALGGNGWLILCLMNADGSNQFPVFAEGGSVESWARSWSPDSRYLAFTRIYFTYYQGNWYWTNAYLDAWDSQTTTIVRLSHNGYDWRPDWQSTDIVAPSSAVNSLPSESPGPFTVRWGGSDNLSGIGSYDVQVKDGAGGSWVDWQTETTATSAAYPGIGGHTYYFRARARDKSGNLESYPMSHEAVTTVESLAPNSAVQELAEFSKNTATVRWAGSDPGASSIQTYDVQYRDVTAGEGWLDWQSAVVTTSAIFTGTLGQSYEFRVRAIDTAYNQEAYPASADTQTTFYAWAISGQVRDNAGVPVSNAAITTLPEAARVFTSEADGVYAAYVLTPTEVYTVTWAKSGYGSLPTTGFISTTDASADIFLPPVDNVIQDGNFEVGDLAVGNWTVYGTVTPTLVNLHHTGRYAIRLGLLRSFKQGLNVSNNSGESVAHQFAWGPNDDLHLVWMDDSSGNVEIYYKHRGLDGTWSDAENISNSGYASGPPHLVVDQLGIAHVVWHDILDGGSQSIYYIRREASGIWSVPENVSRSTYAQTPSLIVDSPGTVHVAWEQWGVTCGVVIYSARRAPNGLWSPPTPLSTVDCYHDFGPQLKLDQYQVVHITWTGGTISGYSDIYYARLDPSGMWSLPENISNDEGPSQSQQYELDDQGKVHVVWASLFPSRVYYAQRASSGGWSPVVYLSDSDSVTNLGLAIQPEEGVHIAWVLNGDIYHIQQNEQGGWLPAVNISQTSGASVIGQLANSRNGVQLVWSDMTLGNSDIYYTWQDHEGRWHDSQNISNSPDESGNPSLTLSEAGTHVVWQETLTGTHELFYSTLATAEQTGDSVLSQSVTLPITDSTTLLSFLYTLHDISTTGNEFTISVDDGLTVTTVFSTTSGAPTWTHRFVDLSSWLGKSITLTFNLHEVIDAPHTWAYLDDVSLGSAFPDVGVGLSGPMTGLPNTTLTYYVTYHNQGGAPAPGTQLTLTLPAELTFVDASLPPLTSTSEIVWDVGNLSAKSGPYTIVVTATVAPTATFFTTLTSTVSLNTSGAELETANNGAQASTFIAYQIFFPVVRRD